MDHQNFDALVARLAATSNRRLHIQSVSFGILAAVASPSLTDAKRKRKKTVRCALLGGGCTGEGSGNCCDALAASAVCSAVSGQPGFGTCCVPSGWSPTAPVTPCAPAPRNAPPVANPACCSGFCSAVEGQFECA